MSERRRVQPGFDDEIYGPPEFIKDPVRAAKRRWRWMLGTLLLGLAATVVYALRIEPRFTATATLLISSQQIPEEFVRPTVRDDSLERINAMVGSILSKTRLSALIEKHGLYPELRNEVPMGDLVELMRSQIAVDQVPGVESFRRAESATQYAIAFTDANPEMAASVVNELAGLFTESSIEMRQQQARLTTEFLSRELDQAERELRAHEAKIREFNETYRGELPDELEANLRKLDQIQSQRQTLSMQIAEGETRLAMLLTPSNSDSPEMRLASLRARLAEESSVHTDEHPNVRSLRRQIATLEKEIARSATDGSSGYLPRTALIAAERKALDEMRRQLALTDERAREVDQRIANTPKRQEEYNALEEKAEVLRANYRDFLQKVQEAELAQNLESAQQGERVTVLDRADPPSSPDQSRLKYLLLGSLASVVLAVGVGAVLELADPVVVSPEHIESAFGRRVLGSVYRIS